MNILIETKQYLTDALMHYVCMRMQFRTNLLSETAGKPTQDKIQCSNKECMH